MIMPVRAQFQTGWATFVAMKDGFDQCLYRPQGEVAREVAREVLRARDLLIDLEKGALHPCCFPLSCRGSMMPMKRSNGS